MNILKVKFLKFNVLHLLDFHLGIKFIFQQMQMLHFIFKLQLILLSTNSNLNQKINFDINIKDIITIFMVFR